VGVNQVNAAHRAGNHGGRECNPVQVELGLAIAHHIRGLAGRGVVDGGADHALAEQEDEQGDARQEVAGTLGDGFEVMHINKKWLVLKTRSRLEDKERVWENRQEHGWFFLHRKAGHTKARIYSKIPEYI